MPETGTEPLFPALTPKQEARMLGWIKARIMRLSPAGRRWLIDWLASSDEC